MRSTQIPMAHSPSTQPPSTMPVSSGLSCRQAIRPVPLVQVSVEKRAEKDQESPNIVLNWTSSTGPSEWEEAL